MSIQPRAPSMCSAASAQLEVKQPCLGPGFGHPEQAGVGDEVDVPGFRPGLGDVLVVEGDVVDEEDRGRSGFGQCLERLAFAAAVSEDRVVDAVAFQVFGPAGGGFLRHIAEDDDLGVAGEGVQRRLGACHGLKIEATGRVEDLEEAADLLLGRGLAVALAADIPGQGIAGEVQPVAVAGKKASSPARNWSSTSSASQTTKGRPSKMTGAVTT